MYRGLGTSKKQSMRRIEEDMTWGPIIGWQVQFVGCGLYTIRIDFGDDGEMLIQCARLRSQHSGGTEVQARCPYSEGNGEIHRLLGQRVTEVHVEGPGRTTVVIQFSGGSKIVVLGELDGNDDLSFHGRSIGDWHFGG